MSDSLTDPLGTSLEEKMTGIPLSIYSARSFLAGGFAHTSLAPQQTRRQNARRITSTHARRESARHSSHIHEHNALFLDPIAAGVNSHLFLIVGLILNRNLSKGLISDRSGRRMDLKIR
jgi:hypothetical protein